MSELDQQPAGGVSRRTVTKAMAWAVPAIAIAAPAPAFAASGAPPTVQIGTACKLPGNSINAQGCAGVFANCPGLDTNDAYAFPLLVTNNTNKTIVLKPVITISTLPGELQFSVKCISPNYGTPLAPGSSTEIFVYANGTNSANQTAHVTVTVPWGHTLSDTDHPPIVLGPITFSAFPPCSSKLPFPQGAPTCTPPFQAA